MELNPLKWLSRSASVQQARSMGGVFNAYSGLGGASDRNASTQFGITTLENRDLIDRAVAESWFLRDLVNIPVDDMFVLWREFEGDDADLMEAAELRYRVRTQLANAIKAGRKYGTGLLLMISLEDTLDTELDAERIRPDDLRNLVVASRFDVASVSYDDDLQSFTFGRPLLYRVRVHDYRTVDIHASRVLRFDGSPPNRQSIYSRDWGNSVLIPAWQAGMQDLSLFAAVSHLVQEASTKTLKLDGLNEQVAQFGYEMSGDANPSVAEKVRDFNRMSSVFGTNVVDMKDEIERTEVGWGQLPRVIAEIYKRLGAISGIPATRLYGTSPVGMNATGESDLVNYAMSVSAMQNNMLSEPLKTLDMVLARSMGLSEPPAYRFASLLQTSEETQADTMGKLAAAVGTAVDKFIIDEDEARAVLAESGLFGDLDGSAPEPELPVTPVSDA